MHPILVLSTYESDSLIKMSKDDDDDDDDEEEKPQQQPLPKPMRKKRRLPPSRLAWPAGGDSIANSSINTTSTSTRHRTITSYAAGHSLKAHSSASATSRSNLDRKATTSSSTSGTFPSNKIKTSHGHGHGHGTAANGKRHRSNEQMWVDKYKPTLSKSLCVAPKKVKEVKEWLQGFNNRIHPSNPMNGIGIGTGTDIGAKLLVLVGSPGIGKSTMVHVVAQELNLSVLEWNDNYSEYSGRMNDMIGYESQMTVFEEFLSSAAFQYESVSGVVEQRNIDGGKNNGSLVMIDELPNLHTKEAEEQFRYVDVVQNLFLFFEVCTYSCSLLNIHPIRMSTQWCHESIPGKVPNTDCIHI